MYTIPDWAGDLKSSQCPLDGISRGSIEGALYVYEGPYGEASRLHLVLKQKH